MDIKQELAESVATATNVNDLISILNRLPLDNIKTFINQQLDELDANSLKTTYFNSSNIHQILPSDIVQYFLSFAGFYHTKGVNKKWKQLSNKNEKMHILQINESINKNKPSELHYDKEKNNTWIIHQQRTKLHPMEIELGYKMCKSEKRGDIQSCIDQCKPGDRILIYDGNYDYGTYNYGEWEGPDEFIEEELKINKDIELIGIGSAVNIYDSRMYPNVIATIGGNANVYFENIRFFGNNLSQDTEKGNFYIMENSKVWMNQVRFDVAGNGIIVCDAASLNATNCEFSGGTVGIEIKPFSKEVEISQCVFRDFQEDHEWRSKEGCILICDREHIQNTTSSDQLVELKCNGNVFKNNACYPVDTMLHNSYNDMIAKWVNDPYRCMLSNNYINEEKVEININIDCSRE